MSSHANAHPLDAHSDSPHADYIGDKVGFWFFLYTELVLFGGLFLGYFFYHMKYKEAFHSAGSHLNVFMGAGNTVVLLTSSLTMVMALTAIQKGKRGLSLGYLFITIACALGFMVVKYFEWGAKFHHGLYPGSAELQANYPEGEIIFFGLYFVMTGTHGLHVILGLLALTWMFVWVWQGKVHKNDYAYMENVGLYWHLVDLIWIYLFPLLYLVA